MASEFPLWEGAVGVRPFRPDEAPAFAEAVRESYDDLAPWMPWASADYGLASAEAWIADTRAALEVGARHELAIVDRDDRLLGGCGLNQRSDLNRYANLGYWVRTSAAGRGVAAAATRRIARFGFERLGLERVEILVVVENVRSLRAAEKAGARREGVLRNRIRLHGRQWDCVVHSLVPGDMRGEPAVG